MWKFEYIITKGSGVFLSPKSYDIYDETGDCTKRALKGIQNQETLNHADFLDALYYGKKCERDQCGFKHSRTAKKIETVIMRKNALNHIYTKMRVNSDLCTVTPLELDGQFL